MTPHSPNVVRTGLDVLLEKDLAPLQGKRVGIVTNHTGRTRDGRHIGDVLLSVRESASSLNNPSCGHVRISSKRSQDSFVKSGENEATVKKNSEALENG